MDSEVVGSAEISALIVHSCSHAVAAWLRWAFRGSNPSCLAWFEFFGSPRHFLARVLQSFRWLFTSAYPISLLLRPPRTAGADAGAALPASAQSGRNRCRPADVRAQPACLLVAERGPRLVRSAPGRRHPLVLAALPQA